MSKSWTPDELAAASSAMKAAGHMSYEEFCAAPAGAAPYMSATANSMLMSSLERAGRPISARSRAMPLMVSRARRSRIMRSSNLCQNAILGRFNGRSASWLVLQLVFSNMGIEKQDGCKIML